MDKRVKKRRTIETDGTKVVEEDLNGDDDDLDGFAPVPYAVIYEKHAVTAVPCWGCIHTFRKPDNPKDNPTLDHLWGEYEKNVSTMSSKQLARHLYIEFRRTVYEPLMEDGEECMEWPESVIKRHIEGRHGLIKSVELSQSIAALSNVEREILDGMFYQKDGVQGFRFNDRRVDSLCKIVSTKQKLLSSIKD